MREWGKQLICLNDKRRNRTLIKDVGLEGALGSGEVAGCRGAKAMARRPGPRLAAASLHMAAAARALRSPLRRPALGGGLKTGGNTRSSLRKSNLESHIKSRGNSSITVDAETHGPFCHLLFEVSLNVHKLEYSNKNLKNMSNNRSKKLEPPRPNTLKISE